MPAKRVQCDLCPRRCLIDEGRAGDCRARVNRGGKLIERCQTISYTYTDPIIYYEYAYDCCVAARAAGIRNVLVTAGYINPEPWRNLLKVADGAHIDLKYFDDALYRANSGGALQPVLDTLLIAKEMGVWFEIINLLIPTISDRPEMIEKMCEWIVKNLGPDVPLHLSRFYPQYQLRELPVTPDETLDMAARIAKNAGIHYIYVGNRPGQAGESTFCPKDGALLIRRTGYIIHENNIKDGHCPQCGAAIAGVWK
ncbi:MAG: AmmeMemoRadiSam system radical SAM enzyme [Candidatus Sumerlaeota bacterium]|nr:AmmeMemoRadiSam system radical SAM enzyme [Candidatus Sumerlaeota bacterium]